MTCGELLIISSSNTMQLSMLPNQRLREWRVALPFKERSSSLQDFPLDTAGPIAAQGCVQASHAASNTSVRAAEACMQPSPARSGTPKSLPTPVKVNKLHRLLAGYDSTLKGHLVSGFTYGFRINSSILKQGTGIPKNHKSARDNKDIVSSKLEKEISLGRVKGPFSKIPFSNFISSPLGLVPKKETGQYRLIHDLSYPKGDSVNSHIPEEFTSVSYQNIETVIELVQSYGFNCLMSKADIKDAFRLIPLHPDDYHLLGFHWNDHFYYDMALPMGASSSCQLFESFSTALQWILNERLNIAGISHLLDDFFFVGEADSNACSVALNTFLCLAEELGVPIKSEKTQSPSTCITIYGIEIDSSRMIARLPQDKIAKITSLLLEFKGRRKVTLRELQSLLGLLNFACSVIVPGRAFLRRLFDLTAGHTCPHFRITLNSEARADLRAWYDFILNYNGKSCFLFKEWVSSETIKLYSDAAGVHGGFAAVFGDKWFAGYWPEEMKDLHITVKELFPIVLALEIWGPALSNHKILFITDNQAVSEIINKTSSKDKNLMRLVRRLVLASLKFNVFCRSKHISGKSNVVCDLLSRFSFQEAFQIAPWLSKHPVVVPSHLVNL